MSYLRKLISKPFVNSLHSFKSTDKLLLIKSLIPLPQQIANVATASKKAEPPAAAAPVAAAPKSGVEQPVIPLDEVVRFIRDCLRAVGTPKEYATAQGKLLAEADKRGHISHGMNRLEMYLNEIECCVCDPCAEPCIIQESASTAWVDACNGLGSTSGNFCMKLAIKKAKKTGVGWVISKHGNHNGIGAWYTMMAVKNGLIGIALTNSSPLMAPTRSKVAAIGTNPISLGAPGEDGDLFLLDIATSAVALGKIEIAQRLAKPIPVGWAKDMEGKITTDAAKALEAKILMPLGGTEENSGYKGFGLAMLVEILTAVMSGARYGPRVKKWMTYEKDANLGQCFIAINPSCFGKGFQRRLSDIICLMRTLEPTDPKKPVMIPGDIETCYMRNVKKQGGVIYSANQMETCNKLSKKLKVKPLKAFKPGGDQQTKNENKCKVKCPQANK